MNNRFRIGARLPNQTAWCALNICFISTLFIGCPSPTTSTPSSGIEEPEPSAPREVGLDLPVISLDTTCVDLPSENQFTGVGGDGSLWLSTEERGVFRVFSVDGKETEIDLSMKADIVRPWSVDAAAFAVGNQLFVKDSTSLKEIRWPAELGEITDFCGDPRLDGSFVVAASAVYQRAGNEWWRWSPPSGSFGAGLSIADLAGACSGPDDRVWFMEPADLYMAREDEFLRFEPADQIAIDPHVGIAARRAETLEFLEVGEWVQTNFAAGPVENLVGTAGQFWVRAGGKLHHYAAGQFSLAEFTSAPGGQATLHPEPMGGMWMVTDTQACHAKPDNTLVIRGLRPFERTAESERTVEFDVPMKIEVDGELVHDGEGPALLSFEATGWHTALFQSAESERKFDVFRADPYAPNWEDDVQPIAETHCGGATCHGGESRPGQPRLLTYDDWVERSGAILNRVGVVGDMPPASSRIGWTAADATTLVAWIGGGKKEGSSDE